MTVRKIPINFIMIFIIFTFLSGVFGVLSVSFDTPVLRLWKEIFITLLFIVTLIALLPNIHKSTFFFIWLICLFYSLIILNSLSMEINLILYQLKLDLFLFVYLLAISIAVKIIKPIELMNVKKNFLFITYILGFINAVVITIQHYFPVQFMNLLDLNWETWGSSSGIKIISTFGEIRAPGLQLGFVPAGSLMLICLIILIESQKAYRLRKSVLFVLLISFVLGIIFSTYKTSIMGLALYGFYKLIELVIKNRSYRRFFISFVSVLVFLLFFISTHFMVIYDIVNRFSPYMAHNSIYIRILQHREILAQFNGINNFLLGVGMGKNGSFGYSNEFRAESIATDSTFIYLVSNYGFIVAILYVVLLIVIIRKIFTASDLDIFGAKYIMLHLLVIEYFYNNTVTSFPINILVITIVVLVLDSKRKSQLLKEDNFENSLIPINK